MVKRLSLGEQFRANIGRKIRYIGYRKSLELVCLACDNVVLGFDYYRRFYNRTGNAYTSFTGGVFYNGKLMYEKSVGDNEEKPTMKSLKEGQVYPLDYYYKGNPVDKKHPYIGEVGKGGQWGPNLIYGRIGKFKPGGEWALMCVCPVEYAKFNERIVETVYSTYEDVPFLLQIGIAETNGTINFDI